MVVPRFVRAALRGEPLTVYGTGRQSRCFCNVADVVDAVVGLMDCPAAVGRGRQHRLGRVHHHRRPGRQDHRPDRLDQPIRRLTYEEAYGRAFDDMLVRKPDLSKIKRLIGYEPTRSLDQTLAEIVAFEAGRR